MLNKMSINQLVNELYCLDPTRQIAAVSRIKEIRAKPAIPDLIKLLSSPEEDVRWLVVEALADIADIGDNITGQALALMLFDESSLVRCDTIYALSDLNYKLATENIEKLLIDDIDWLVRVAAAETLANLATKGEFGTITTLERALDDPIQSVRSFAACSIGLIGVQNPTLIKNLDIHLISEESIGTKVEIIGAKCRLGFDDDFLRIFELFMIAEEEDFSRILNCIEDLSSRNVPTCVISNKEYICCFLNNFSNLKSQFKKKCEGIILRIEEFVKLQ
jgi:HEAT repeat protein